MSGAGSIQRHAAAFGVWWLDEWRACLPAFRSAGSGSRELRLVIRPLPDGVRVQVIHPRRGSVFDETAEPAQDARSFIQDVSRRAEARAGTLRIVLALDGGSLVQGSLLIPEQARSRAAAIMREAVARKTPLSPGDLIAGHDLRPAAPGKLELRYGLIGRSALDRVLARLSIPITQIDCLQADAPDGGKPLEIPLRPAPEVLPPSTLKAACILVSAGVCAAILGVGSLAWRQHRELASLEAQLAAVAPDARRAAEALRGARAHTDQAREFGAARRAPGVVRVWEELARLIPDTTYLTDFEILGRDVTVSGYSDAAAALVRQLEASPILEHAALTGPIVVDRAKGKEHFTLKISLRSARLDEAGEN